MARLSLEHFKLLTARSPALEVGTGGTPDITFQELSDVLAKVSSICRIYARWHFAMYMSLGTRFRRALLVKVLTSREAGEIKAPAARWIDHIELALLIHKRGEDLTKFQKAREVKQRWWRKRNDRMLRLVQAIVDDLDFEIRRAISEWNENVLIIEV